MDDPILSGRLGPLAVQDVMGFLATMRLDGRLSVRTDGGEVVLVFDGGKIDGVEVRRGAVDAAEVLARIPSLDPGLRRSLLKGAGAVGTLAERLERSAADEDLARRILVEEVLAVMIAVSEWKPATFRFDLPHAGPRSSLALELDVPEVLLETARRVDETGSLPELYTDVGTRFEMLGDPGESGETVSLGLEEWKVLYLVSNRISLGEIREASGIDSEVETSRILFALASAGLIRPLEPERSEKASVEESATNVGYSGAIDLSSFDVRGAEEPESPLDSTLPADTAERMPVFPDGDSGRRPRPSGERSESVISRASGRRRLSRYEIRVRRRASLRRLVGPSAGGVPELFRIEADDLTLGRKSTNGLVLPNAHVSGVHARFRKEGERYVIEDQGSVNGFAVDGRRRKRALLRGGEQIEIYPFVFRFEVEFDVDEIDDGGTA